LGSRTLLLEGVTRKAVTSKRALIPGEDVGDVAKAAMRRARITETVIELRPCACEL
jgi:hypothetical protein